MNRAALADADLNAAVLEAALMLQSARYLGVAQAIDDIQVVRDGLEGIRGRLQKIASRLDPLLAQVRALADSPPEPIVIGQTIVTPRAAALTMIEVPGAGRVPVGHRSGLMGRGDYRPGIHEYGKSASFSPGERRIAESLHRRHPGEAFHAWADDRGKSKLKNPDCIRRPNPERPGIPVEFKTLESATSNAVHQRIRSAAQQIEDHGGGEVVIDGHDLPEKF